MVRRFLRRALSGELRRPSQGDEANQAFVYGDCKKKSRRFITDFGVFAP
jgi:hypothetical protein